MKINALDLIGFGKFKNQKIEFVDGINLVFGDNESGKSTLQTFIKAMFFSARNIKSTDYIKRFEPWQGEHFGGSLHYSLDNDQHYKIERNFKNNEIKIFDHKFNEVSSSFDTTREKGPLFAYKHLGVNEQFFEQTVFVKQMETRLSVDARKNILESTVNLIQTGMENISLERILDELNSLLKLHIGNSRTRLRPLEQIISEIDDIRALIEEKQMERQKLIENISENTNFLKESNFENQKLFIEQALELLNLKRELSVLEDRKTAQENVYRSLRVKNEYIKEGEEKKEKYISELRGELEKLLGDLTIKGERLSNMELELEKSRLGIKTAESYNTKIEANLKIIQKENSIEKELKVTDVLFKRYDVAMPTIIAVIVYFILKIFSYSQKFSSVALLFAIFYPAVMVIVEYKRKNEERNKASKQLKEIFEELGVVDATMYYRNLSDFEIRIKEFDNLSNEIEELESRVLRIEELISDGEGGLKNIAIEESEISYAKKQLDEILCAYFLIEKKIDFVLENLKKVSENEGLFELWEELIKCCELGEAETSDFVKDLQMRISKAQEEAFIKLKENEMVLRSLEEKDREITKMEEELVLKELKKNKMEDINFSLSTAISVFKNAGEELKNGTMPMLINNFSNVVERITSGKYKNLSIDDRFEIKAIEPLIENIINVTTLSGGTLEQIYLALRISLADSAMTGKEKLPLILDEVFAYYDDKRTVECCKFLKELSIDRQVILFTCKEREIEIAKEIFERELNCIRLS
jgi:DNA repair exonuclease SbcCD ATPase subunit